jgi:putative ABC transport system permease protein
MIAVALLGPVVVGWPTALIGQGLRAVGGSGFLAAGALRTGRFRVGAVAAAIALVVALAGAEVVSLATVQRMTQRTTAQRVRADQVLVARQGGGLPPSIAAQAARIPGVTAAGMVSTEVYLLDGGLTNQGDSWKAAGLDPTTTPRTLDLGIEQGSLAALTGNDVAVSDAIARHGVRLGSLLHARWADGTPALLRVVAVYRRANGMGDVVLPRPVALRHAQAALDSAVFIRAAHTPAAARALDRLTQSLPTAVLESRAQYLDNVKAQSQDQARAQWVVVALMLLVSVMAAFNTGAMAASERRKELVLARLSGATRAQVVGALALEALVTTLVGITVGSLVALLSLAGAGSDPAGGSLAIPLGQAALVLGGAAALGAVGTLIPTALLGRARLTGFAGARE